MDPVIEQGLAKLAPLLGTWSGQGEGSFPTIDSFLFRETFTVSRHGDADFFAYQQATVLVDAGGEPIRASHFETGVIRPLEDGAVEVACIHNHGRVEVLRGAIDEAEPGRLHLQLRSVILANDDRMKSSARNWRIVGDDFEVVMHMDTTGVDAETFHLKCHLLRR